MTDFQVASQKILRKVKTAIFISGRGSNMIKLIESSRKHDSFVRIDLVLSNNSSASGLEIARNFGIETIALDHKLFSRQEFDDRTNDILQEKGIEFICLAGFMRVLTSSFVEKWEGRIVNIHPSLLPSFKGINAIGQAFDYGVKYTGVTTHFVSKDIDSGKIIEQIIVKIENKETLASLEEKIHKAEHQIYPKTMQFVAKEILSKKYNQKI